MSFADLAQGLPTNPYGLIAFVIFAVLQYLLRRQELAAHRLFEAARDSRLQMMISANPTLRELIVAHPEPAPPPKRSPMTLLMLAGAIGGLIYAAAHGELRLASHLAAPIEEHARSAPVRRGCTSDTQCSSGCKCDGICKCAARRPASLAGTATDWPSTSLVMTSVRSLPERIR